MRARHAGRCDRSARPASCSVRYRPTHRCTVDAMHPDLAATSVTSAPANTARTASNRCSTTDKTTSANPGLPESRTPHGDVADSGCRHGPCRTSADGRLSHITRRSTATSPEDRLRLSLLGQGAGSAGAARLRAALARRPRAPQPGKGHEIETPAPKEDERHRSAASRSRSGAPRTAEPPTRSRTICTPAPGIKGAERRCAMQCRVVSLRLSRGSG